MKKPCATCPFLKANTGKPTPTDFNCVEQNETDWYAQWNIDGVWDVTRKNPITFLSCHSTDPDYYGKKGNPTYACVGATLAIQLHLQIFEQVGNYHKYVAIVGKELAFREKALEGKKKAIENKKTDPAWGKMIIATDATLNLEEMRWPTGFQDAVNYLYPKKQTFLPTHSCFDDAAEIIAHMASQSTKDHMMQHVKLAHGICTVPPDIEYAHGWVEYNGNCLFKAIPEGEEAKIIAGDKEGFYETFRVKKATLYSLDQAIALSKLHGGSGPWEDEYKKLVGNGDSRMWDADGNLIKKNNAELQNTAAVSTPEN